MPIHNIDPVYDDNSKILILGSFPSVKSRETGFYYGNPHNRFWKILSVLFEEEVPETIEDKKAFLLRNRIALWDVVKSCDIRGSDDNSIDNVEVNNLSIILDRCDIENIYLNGLKAQKLYKKYLHDLNREGILLKSSSPANASCSLDDLLADWKKII